MLFRLLTLLIQSKKTGYDIKVEEIEKKKIKINYDHTKYFTIQEFAKLTAETFTAS